MSGAYDCNYDFVDDPLSALVEAHAEIRRLEDEHATESARLRLTDAEREALGEMAEICDSRERLSLNHQLDDEADHWRCRAVTLRGILTRTGGEK